MLIDTHTHVYLPEFDLDRDQMLHRAFQKGVSFLLLPNIDLDSVHPMMNLASSYSNHCLPMMGLHPCSVGEHFKDTLQQLGNLFSKYTFYGVGEIGLDLYWDKTYWSQQLAAFRTQLEWAKELDLAVSIHSREATQEALDIVREMQDGRLKGVFHCFGGTLEQAKALKDLGFYLGIGGVVSFKNSGLGNMIQEMGLGNLVLETDAPYLSPVPHRGKRNEPAYLDIIANRIAEFLEFPVETVIDKTTENAISVFDLKDISLKLS